MKRVILSFACIAFFLSGCNQEPVDLDQERQVVIYFSPKPSAYLLKSSATDDEKEILKIAIFGVEGQNIIKKFDVIDNPSLDGELLTISRRVTSLYAIANLDVDAATLSTVSDLTSLTGSFLSSPAKPFLMSGIATDLNRTAKTVSIDLVRAVAKVQIIGEEFEIETVTVKNTPNMGYVFGKIPWEIPTTTTRINYSSVAYDADKALYVAENVSTNATVFEVTGKYLGKTAIYPIVLKKGTNNIDILRNTHYTVTITAITEDEFTIELNILDWEEEETDTHEIPDSAFQ